MPTQRVYVTIVLCTVILFSCINKKEKSSAEAVAATAFDTVKLLPDQPIDIAAYNNAFVENSSQQFIASSKKISIITAAKGLKVTVDPKVLEKEDGSVVDGKIAVSIIELTTGEELFKSNAATMSDGRLLASGGSYFIGMECNGQKLRIKNNRSLQVEFPVIKQNEMELFYGERNEANDMNWVSAGISLEQKEPEEKIEFTNNNDYMDNFSLPSFALTKEGNAKIFRTLDDHVYYYEKLVTIKNLVDTINKHRTKIYIDTICMWPKQVTQLLPGQRIDTNYLYARYGPRKQFILKTCKALEEENARKAQEKIQQQEAIEKWQPKSLAGQLQKYYTPTDIRYLGWINCDRYQNNKPTDIELDLPITFDKGSIQYFVIFKSFNGLISGTLNIIKDNKMSLGNLPANEPITLIAFTKNNGQIFHCKEEFVIQKNKIVKPDFKNISVEEMSKIFGTNVRI